MTVNPYRRRSSYRWLKKLAYRRPELDCAGGGLHASWTDAGQNRFYIPSTFHAAVRGPQLVRRIHECLNRSGLNPDQLKIGGTERVLLQDMDYMKMMMEEMTGEGFGFYLDDSVPDTPIYPVHCPYPLSTLSWTEAFWYVCPGTARSRYL